MERTLSHEEQILIGTALHREIGYLQGELIDAANEYDIDRIERLTMHIRMGQKLLAELSQSGVHMEIKR